MVNKKCQVFTPSDNVIELLDRVGYNTNLFGKKVIENACGDGNILTVIVERYIKDSLNRNISIEDIKAGLEQDIYGAEIDRKYYLKCMENLNYVANTYNIYDVSWNLLNVDILKEELSIKFDYVIGNPPYITYRELDYETRIYLRETFDVCKEGKFDYSYAFIEASLRCLNDTGKLSYLIPSSIFKNVFAQRLRDYMLPSLCEIYNYTTKKLFDNILTSSAIVIFDKGNLTDTVRYFDIAKKESFNIDKNKLVGKWIFTEHHNEERNAKMKFDDFFTASISVATLLNEAFVIKKYEKCEENEEYINIDNFQIEKSVLKVAASPRGLNYNRKELIIYPYYYKDDNLIRYSEEEFIKKFPNTTKYLRSFLDKLKKRKSDRNVQWYEYGRSQALAHLNQTKLIISTIITKEVKVYELCEDCIPYSGIYIISKGILPLSTAKKILESESFLKYVQDIGINANGNSLRITPADINNYEFSNQEEK